MTLKTNKNGVIGANKRGKTLAGHDLCKNLFKEEVWGNILYGKDNVLIEDGSPVDKIGNVFRIDSPQIVDFFFRPSTLPLRQGTICGGYFQALFSRHHL